jgi:hypothetical protein
MAGVASARWPWRHPWPKLWQWGWLSRACTWVRHDEAATVAHVVERKKGMKCGTMPVASLAMAAETSLISTKGNPQK